ncbi:MAG: hypothetical protein ABI670_07315 [Chloroflexota bacterium]
MKRLCFALCTLMGMVLLVALSLGSGRSASAQAAVPDFTQFGFPQVVGSVTFTPGTAATITGGNQQVVLPADFISKTVTFDLLQGDPAFFAPALPITDQGRTVVVAFAFRVTDVATNQIVGRFDKPVQWSVTDPGVVAGSAVFNTTAANPPVVTANSAPGTISGTTLSHPFGGAGVGWLILGAPAAAAATPGTTETPGAAATVAVPPTTVPTEVATTAPTEVPTVAPPAETATPTVIGMPATGGSSFGAEVALLALLGIAGTAAGLLLRRRRAS